MDNPSSNRSLTRKALFFGHKASCSIRERVTCKKTQNHQRSQISHLKLQIHIKVLCPALRKLRNLHVKTITVHFNCYLKSGIFGTLMTIPYCTQVLGCVSIVFMFRHSIAFQGPLLNWYLRYFYSRRLQEQNVQWAKWEVGKMGIVPHLLLLSRQPHNKLSPSRFV